MPIDSIFVWGTFLVGILSISGFFWRQSEINHPVINLEIFSNSMFVKGLTMMALSIICVLATAITLPIYFIDVLLLQAALAGFILLPGNIINVIFSPVIGSMYNRYNILPFVLIGSMSVTLSAIIFLSIMNGSTNEWAIAVPFMLLCFGVTCIIMPVQTAALSALPKSLYSDGSSVWNTLYQISGAAGSSIAVSLISCFGGRSVAGEGRISGAAELTSGVNAVFYFILALGIISLLLSFMVRPQSPDNK